MALLSLLILDSVLLLNVTCTLWQGPPGGEGHTVPPPRPPVTSHPCSGPSPKEPLEHDQDP